MGVGQQPLEPAVLGLELLQALGVLGLHAAVLGPPGVEAGGTEAVLATQFRHRHAGLGLLDESDDLLGCEATLAHVRPLGLTDFTASRGTAQRGQVNSRSRCYSKLGGRRRQRLTKWIVASTKIGFWIQRWHISRPTSTSSLGAKCSRVAIQDALDRVRCF